jgi:hypothetical protein
MEGTERRHDDVGHVALVIHHEHAERFAGARLEAMDLLETLELVHEDPEMSTRDPERGELALLDPLLDGGRRNLKHFTYFTGRQISSDAPLPGHGTRSGG